MSLIIMLPLIMTTVTVEVEKVMVGIPSLAWETVPAPACTTTMTMMIPALL